MADLTEFLEESAGNTKRKRMDTIREALPPDKLERLEEARTNPEITGAAIARVLTRWGHPVAPSTVSEWRRNG